MTHRDTTLSLVALCLGWSLLGCADAAPPTAPDPAPEPAPGVTRTVYRIGEVLLPPTSHDASQLGRDLDGDGLIDNRLGLVHGLLAERWDLSLSSGASAALRDEVPWLLVVDAVPGARALDVWLAPSVDGDVTTPDLARAVSAHGRWSVDGASATVDGGRGLVPIGVLGDPAPEQAAGASAGWCESSAMAMALEPSPDGVAVQLGLALDVDQVRAAIAAPLARFLTGVMGGDAVSASFARDADTDGDGVVSTAEVLGHPLLTGLLSADLDLDGDGVDEAISLGLWVDSQR